MTADWLTNWVRRRHSAASLLSSIHPSFLPSFLPFTQKRYPVFAAAAPGYQQDEWDEIGCDLTCAVESCYLDDLKTAVEQAEAAQIPRNYPFPDEEEVQLVDTVIKLLAEMDPQPDAAGAAAAGTST